MVKLFYHKNYYVGWCSELILLYDDIKHTVNDKRFDGIINNSFNYVDNIEESDYVVLPYKWRGLDDTTNYIINECIKNNKKILIFYNDDSDEIIPVEENVGYIFRTSFKLSTKKSNEFALVPFFDDCFTNKYIIQENIKLNIGFCGYDHFQRKFCLDKIKKCNDITSDFIIRKSFWAKEIEENKAIIDFNKNIIENLFNFTSRGSGNFSYRFYQILSMGRIPVLLDTDTVLPFTQNIDYNQHCVIVDESEIDNISKLIVNFYNSKTKEELYQIQKNNRDLYLKYFSPNGFIKNIENLLKINGKTKNTSRNKR